MDITPSGNLRIVFTGPLRLVLAEPGNWAPIPRERLAQAIADLAAEGHFRLRAAEEDQSAIDLFKLKGTSESPYPLDMVQSVDLPPDAVADRLLPLLKPMTGRGSPFVRVMLKAAVLRIFANGYGAVVFAVELIARRDVDADAYIAFLAQRFDFMGPANEKLRAQCLEAVQGMIRASCAAIITRCGLSDGALDGKVHFLGLFYVVAAEWDPSTAEELRLDPRLRPMLQPEAGDDLVNQSPFRSELVLYTSGFHMYVWNSRVTANPTPRAIALVAFAALMNILWDQMEVIMRAAEEKLRTKKIFLRERTDTDERVEILYRKVMVLSLSWRRDFSAFRDQIDRRWKVGEMKDYCLLLLAELEAQSDRQWRMLVGGILLFIAVASLVSIVADGLQVAERWGLISAREAPAVSKPPPARAAPPPAGPSAPAKPGRPGGN